MSVGNLDKTLDEAKLAQDSGNQELAEQTINKYNAVQEEGAQRCLNSYYQRLSSGDIGIENRNVCSEANDRMPIPMRPYNHRLHSVPTESINERKPKSLATKEQMKPAKKKFSRDVEVGGTDFVYTERYQFKNNAASWTSMIFLVIFAALLLVLFVYGFCIKKWLSIGNYNMELDCTYYYADKNKSSTDAIIDEQYRGMYDSLMKLYVRAVNHDAAYTDAWEERLEHVKDSTDNSLTKEEQEKAKDWLAAHQFSAGKHRNWQWYKVQKYIFGNALRDLNILTNGMKKYAKRWISGDMKNMTTNNAFRKHISTFVEPIPDTTGINAYKSNKFERQEVQNKQAVNPDSSKSTSSVGAKSYSSSSVPGAPSADVSAPPASRIAVRSYVPTAPGTSKSNSFSNYSSANSFNFSGMNTPPSYVSPSASGAAPVRR